MLRRCTEHGRFLCIWCFTQTLAFPVEHFVWERAPLLRVVTHYLGL